MAETLEELAGGRSSCALAAAALVELGVAPTTRLSELTAGSVASALAEALAREIARLHQQLEEVYSGAFVETESAASFERLVERIERRRPWWHRLLRWPPRP